MRGTTMIVKGDKSPPADAVVVGQWTLPNGTVEPIYEEAEILRENREVTDSSGAVIYELNADGTKKRPLRMNVEIGVRKKQFILVDLGNGQTIKNYNYPGDEAEQARIAAQQANAPDAMAGRLARLEAFLERLGITDDEVGAEDPAPAAEVPPAETAPRAPKGRG